MADQLQFAHGIRTAMLPVALASLPGETESIEPLRHGAELLARRLSGRMQSLLRMAASVTVAGISEASLAELTAVEQPACIAPLGPAGDAEAALLQVPRALAFAIVEQILGVTATNTTAPDRDLTQVEAALIAPVLKALAGEATAALKTTRELLPHGVRSEPEALPGRVSRLPVAVIRLNISFDTCNGVMVLAISEALLPATTEVAPEIQLVQCDDAEQAAALELLKECQLDLDIRLPGQRFRMADLLSLREGDILSFAQPAGAPLTGYIGDAGLFQGHIAATRGRRIFVIEQQDRRSSE
jgi:flagellar motor switch protein FliM